jgi:DNA-directed RNA polymerase subunit RPC12/RpoP
MAKEEKRQASGDRVVLLVCLACGREYQFEGREEPSSELACEKCGNGVFRRFEDTAVPDEVEADYRETTERDLDTDDAPGDATPGDLHDLKNP